ncbi:hypothetical protein Tco_0844806 [Tanacetum coccineum]
MGSPNKLLGVDGSSISAKDNKMGNEQVDAVVLAHMRSKEQHDLQRPQVILQVLQHLQAILRDLQEMQIVQTIGKLQVLEARLEMYMDPEKHTIDSTALLHELYNDMEKFSLE